jgi:Zn-finger nucleic acid-binding protein
VRYSPCPACAKIMNRVNFARSSGIVLDICKAHGVWLDADELRRVLEFLRAGGLQQAREREKRALDEELRLLRMRQSLARAEQRHYAAADRDEPSADSLLVGIFALFTT